MLGKSESQEKKIKEAKHAKDKDKNRSIISSLIMHIPVSIKTDSS